MDEVNGWDNFELRMWNSSIVRWMSPDPYGQFASAYIGMGNNPVNGRDPDGGYYNMNGKPRTTKYRVVGPRPSPFAHLRETDQEPTGLLGRLKKFFYNLGKAKGGRFVSNNQLEKAATQSAELTIKYIEYTVKTQSMLLGVALGGTIGSSISSSVASALSFSGFSGGVISGAAGGAVSGFATGAYNAAARESISGIDQDIWGSSFKGAFWGGAIGGLAGGINGGISAKRAGANFWDGTAELDLSNGFGAHGIDDLNQTVTGKYVGKYEGVSVFETPELGIGEGSGGITLPGRGITVGRGVFSRGQDIALMQHEFGHILQARQVGNVAFYGIIGKESLISASLHGVGGHNHSTFWTETWANKLSSGYFGSNYIHSSQFPIRELSSFNYFRLRFASPLFWP